jgi:hypothetical protein
LIVVRLSGRKFLMKVFLVRDDSNELISVGCSTDLILTPVVAIDTAIPMMVRSSRARIQLAKKHT